MPALLGIHHVTAIASDPGRNVAFYAGLLGLRLVKRTVNFDDPGSYHLYYGDELGRPGTLITFFPWPGTPRGVLGAGQTAACAFAVPASSPGWWLARLRAAGVAVEEGERRLGEEVLAFADPDGMRLELVGAGDARGGWAGGGVPAEHAIRGLHSVTLLEERLDRTAAVLAALGFRAGGEEGGRSRFLVGDGGPGARVDVVARPGGGRGSVRAGSIHHVAFRTPGDRDQEAWQRELAGLGLNVTPVLDRVYFRSIYFREPGGVLFEIATDPPGFTVDEPPERLGEELRLPPWLEPMRERIEAVLPPLAAATA